MGCTRTNPRPLVVRKEVMTTTLDGALAHTWIRSFSDVFHASEQQLTELDRLAGDGDFGTNIASALRRVAENLPECPDATFASVFTAASTGFLATGGTSGPLFGMWFRAIARVAEDAASVADLARGVRDGLDAIQKLGGASVGDNTMIDALSPASDALTRAAEADEALDVALAAAAEAARSGARTTGDLVASRGRASYVGELARSVLDPGAVTIALFFESGATATGYTSEWTPLPESPAHS